jgi:hypothetical protein
MNKDFISFKVTRIKLEIFAFEHQLKLKNTIKPVGVAG